MRDSYNEINSGKKSRVHIEYEIETENGPIKKQLPFVIGIIGDFSGNASGYKNKEFKDKKFINITKENFNKVMSMISPELKFTVKNTLCDTINTLSVNLKFDSINNFEPQNIAQQVPEIKKLITIREKLMDLLCKTDRSDKLSEIVEHLIKDSTAAKNLYQKITKEQNEE